MIYTGPIHRCEPSDDWPHDRFSVLFASTGPELESACCELKIASIAEPESGGVIRIAYLTPDQRERAIQKGIARELGPVAAYNARASIRGRARRSAALASASGRSETQRSAGGCSSGFSSHAEIRFPAAREPETRGKA